MFNDKKFCGGFIFVELAIALPLLIVLVYGLATVSIKIFEVGTNQLAITCEKSPSKFRGRSAAKISS